MVGELSAVKWGYANGKFLSNTAYLKISMVSMALKYFSNRHGFPRGLSVCVEMEQDTYDAWTSTYYIHLYTL